MDIREYISSGILELYVAGVLTAEENLEVYRNAGQYPEIEAEIKEIEAAILALSKSASPRLSKNKGFRDVQQRIGYRKETKVVQFPERKSNWGAYMGWAASILFAVGLYWMYTENNKLKSDLEFTYEQNKVLEEQILLARESNEKSQELLATLRDKDISVIALAGQTISPESYAKAYWNRTENKVFIDAQGLPEPPEGMVYQVWSLKLTPLTPTSLGLLDDFLRDENKIFALSNPNESEAFGITLEPAGGSESPTMDQLYSLGTVSS